MIVNNRSPERFQFPVSRLFVQSSQQIGKIGAIPVSCFDEFYPALEKSSFAMVMAVIALGQPE
jgi:hypothetical protein